MPRDAAWMQASRSTQATLLVVGVCVLVPIAAITPTGYGLLDALLGGIVLLAMLALAASTLDFLWSRLRVPAEARPGIIVTLLRLALGWIIVAYGLSAAALCAPFPALRAAGKMVSAAMLAPIPDAARGSVDAAGEGIGTWHMVVDSCVSGQRRQFFGVVLYSRDNDELAVKIVQPAIGRARLSINVPGTDHANIYDAEDCPVLNVALHSGASTFNRITNVYGHIRFDCRFNDDHVSGEVTMSYCH
jgi:hypothetical protein